jgi:arylformamidase
VEIYDISQSYHEGMVVWPGDPEFRITRIAQILDGQGVNVSAIHMGTHTGTHLDAPLHLDDAGSGCESIPLHHLIGPARVFEVDSGDGIRVEDLLLLNLQGVRRALFKTRLPKSPKNIFAEDYVALEEKAAKYLAEKNIVLFGIDAPSVDAWNSSSLIVHRTLLKHQIAILEGLQLSSVPPGDYELICLPLKLAGSDGAPARAILRR